MPTLKKDLMFPSKYAPVTPFRAKQESFHNLISNFLFFPQLAAMQN